MIDITVKIGVALDVFGNRITKEWKNEVKQKEGLRDKIWQAVFDLLGFETQYRVMSIRYGSDGTVWVKVKASANLNLDYPQGW